MAQIIKHRRGSLESLASITASLQKGEIVIASGSSNLTVSNGTSLVFAAAENGVLQPINRFLVGTSAPNNFPAATYNGLLNGVPYYDSTSGSLYILGSDTNTKLDLLGNINGFSQSVDSRLDAIESSIGGGGSVGTRVSALEAASASLEAFTGSQETKNNTLGTYTGSIDTKFGTLATYTASTDSRLNNLESFSSSQETKDSTLAIYTGSIDTKWNTIENVTASLQSFTSSQETKNNTLATLTGSIATEQTAQNNRLATIESFTGSYATTGSNVFFGNQVITGSVYIAYNLVVQGSSSLQDITASAVDIGTNRIRLNTDAPAVRFAGLEVYDSGSQQTTGSLYWDSLYNHWISVRPSSSTEVANSAMLIYGPKNTGALGNETGLTAGYIPVAEGEDHIANSIMSQAAGKITLSGSLDVLNEISASTINGIGNVSAFSQSLDSRLDVIETSLGGGGSVGARVSALEVFSGSQETKNDTLASYTSSVDSMFAGVQSSTASLNTFTASANSRLNNLESFSSSQETKDSTLATYTSSVNSQLSNIHSFTSSQETKNDTLATYTASVNNNVSNIHSFTSSVESKFSTLSTYTASVNNNITNIHSFTSSVESQLSTLGTYSSSVNSRLNQLETDSGSQAGRLTNLESFSSSQETKDSTLATYTASVDNRLNLLSSDSASQAGRLNNLELTSASVNVSIAELNSYSASLKSAITVNGLNVTLNGNLQVLGTQTQVDSTTIQLGDNIIELNGTGAANGGIYVKDPTAPNTATGSLIWDSTNDYWKAGVKDAEIKVLLAQGDSVVSGSSQITLQSTTGFASFDSALSATTGSLIASASNAAGRLTVLEGTGTIQGVGTTNTVTFNAVTASNSVNIPGYGTSKRLAFRGTTGNIDFVAAPTNIGDIAQWDGTDFVMSNVIDGGSF
jgi:hypothetical protein